MRFPLRQPALLQAVKIKPDSVRRTVDWMNKSQWHRLKAASDPVPPMKFALYYRKAVLPNSRRVGNSFPAIADLHARSLSDVVRRWPRARVREDAPKTT